MTESAFWIRKNLCVPKHVFYKINLNQALPTNPITEGADAGWGFALASKEKYAWGIISGILPLRENMSRRTGKFGSGTNG
jgi:hypothetical protein